ncbi:hypothetical protein Tsubulata_047828 [Turnera subulata]|nr:hypothetical protein Tsubulata_047828 [Turnera subulata]
MKTPLGTKCIGSAFNLAALILAAGEKGFRSAFPLSTIAVENPAGAAHGQADHIQNETNELLRIKDYINSEFAAKTGQPMEKIAKDFRRMKMLSAREAADYGLIDYVVREAEEELEGDDDAVQND